jgi:hypothetical protein
MKGSPPRAALVIWIRNFWGLADTTLFSMSSGLDSEVARHCAAAGSLFGAAASTDRLVRAAINCATWFQSLAISSALASGPILPVPSWG